MEGSANSGTTRPISGKLESLWVLLTNNRPNRTARSGESTER
jgi:hypothetical protein